MKTNDQDEQAVHESRTESMDSQDYQRVVLTLRALSHPMRLVLLMRISRIHHPTSHADLLGIVKTSPSCLTGYLQSLMNAKLIEPHVDANGRTRYCATTEGLDHAIDHLWTLRKAIERGRDPAPSEVSPSGNRDNEEKAS